MSLESKELFWLECDGCEQTYGDPDDGKNVFGDYEDEGVLEKDAKEDGWCEVGNDWFCEECAPKRGARDLTPLEAAILMHGKTLQAVKS